MSAKLKEVFTKWMEEKRIHPLVHIPMYCLSGLYGVAVGARLGLYSLGVLRARNLPCKVISVGNITVGGTGKTPMAIFLAEYLRGKGLKVGVLSRGYGGKLKGKQAVLSDGKDIFLGPEEAGDEPYLIASRLRGVPVIVGKDRYRSGLCAVERFNIQCLILDDGFQHIQLRRDMNLLLIDSLRGFGNDYLLPRGILREPVSAVKRADVVLVKNDGGRDAFMAARGLPLLSFRYQAKCIIEMGSNKMKDVASLEGKRVFAFAGIASPGAFINTLRDLGADVVSTLFFPDHHIYSEADIESINGTVSGIGDIDRVVMTEKDMVKLKGVEWPNADFCAVAIDVVLEDMPMFEKVMSTVTGGV